MAQPAMSRQMQSLERTVGVPLLQRERRGVRLTRAGQRLQADVRVVFTRLEDTWRRAYLAAAGRLGLLRLGMGRVALDSARVGSGLAEFQARYPEVRLRVEEIATAVHEEKLRDGAIDVGIGLGRENGERRAHERPLFTFDVDSVVIAAGDALARERSVSIAQLRDRPLLLVQPVAGTWPPLASALRSAGIQRWETLHTVESVYSHVAASSAWSLATRLQREKPPAGTAVIPLNDFRVPMSMTARWRGEPSVMVENLLGVLGQPTSRPWTPIGRSGVRIDHDAGGALAAAPSAELRHFRALKAVAVHGSVSRAAEELGITQSGMSRQIRALEKEVGFPLILRDARGAVLTAAGEVLAHEADAVIELVDKAVARSRAEPVGVTGSCRVGVIAMEFVDQILVPALRNVTARNPGMGVEISEMLSLAQIEALRDRRIDVGIAGSSIGIADDTLIERRMIASDMIDGALLPDTHPLATRDRLSPRDVSEMPLLFIERAMQPRFYDSVMDALNQLGIVPRITGTYNGPRAIWRAVADGMGWSLANRSLRDKPLAGLVAVPIEGLGIATGRELLWRRDEDDPGVLAVVDAIRAEAE